jgi:hypothetical protein
MTKEEKTKAATIICEKVGCDAEQTKRHVRLYVEEQWRVHVPLAFKKWFSRHPDRIEGNIADVTAYNAQPYVDQYKEAKEFGLLDEVPKAIFAK